MTSLRQGRGLTIKDAANAIGIAESTLGLLEKDRHDPTLGTMLALVRFYELCSIEELISEGRLGTAELLGESHHRP